MSAVELVGLGEPDRWREALRGIPHGFAHTWESCHAHHSTHLLWSAAHRLRGLGVPSLNLGGGVAEGDSLARFKERFGARKLPLTALKQVYDRAAYERLCRERGADPDDIEAYFPPYRRPARVIASG